MKLLAAACFLVGITFICGANVPGCDLGIGAGFDIVYDEPRGPVLQYNYNLKNEWSYQPLATTYQVPDELWVNYLPFTQYISSSEMYATLNDYITKEYSWHGITIGFPGWFGFQMGKQTGEVKEMMRAGNATVYIVSRVFNIYSISAWPMSALSGQGSSHFTTMLNNLPSSRTTDTEKAAYATFVNTFGTHYTTQATFGGEFSYLLAVNNTLLAKYSSEWVAKQVGIWVSYYDFTFGFTKQSNESYSSVDKEFISNTETKVQFVGGTQDAFNKGFVPWYNSVVSQPAMVQPHLIELDQLVISDPTKRQNLQSAIYEYLSTSPTPKAPFKFAQISIN